MSESVKRDALTLKRWSQRKLAAAREAQSPELAQPAASPTPPASPATSATAPAAPTADACALPPIDSLTTDSDFTAFLRPDVDESVKRGALRKLFSDPRFNVMDGLDVYIDDYSKPDPIAPDIVRTLMQARYIFDPPATRVNAQGNVEDVPAEPPVEAAPAEPLPSPVADADGDGTPLAHDPLPVARESDPESKPQ